MDILEIAQRNQQIGWMVLKQSGIIPIWESIGAKVNLVGSLKTGLLMKNCDVDLHIYTDKLIIADSFRAMAKFAENPAVKDIQYRNLIHTEEECIEWHVLYDDPQYGLWKLDMIHILRGSKYDGVVERVTDRIIELLTPEIKNRILSIKYQVPDGEDIIGLEIYRAVFSYNIREYEDFVEWHKTHPLTNNMEWVP